MPPPLTLQLHEYEVCLEREREREGDSTTTTTKKNRKCYHMLAILSPSWWQWVLCNVILMSFDCVCTIRRKSLQIANILLFCIHTISIHDTMIWVLFVILFFSRFALLSKLFCLAVFIQIHINVCIHIWLHIIIYFILYVDLMDVNEIARKNV